MKKLFTFLLLITSLSNAPLHCQSRIAAMDDKYIRNSLSVILIEHGDSYDQRISRAFNTVPLGDKFDINRIQTAAVRMPYSRNGSKDAFGQRVKHVTDYVNTSDLGRQIISVWFNRKQDGLMDADLVLKRGDYTAIDADYITAAALKTGTLGLGDRGFGLIDNSYVLFVNHTAITSKTDDQGKTTWETRVEGHLYKIEYTDTHAAQLYECWITQDDTAVARRQKNERFGTLKFPLRYVCSSAVNISAREDRGGLDNLIQRSYSVLVNDMEKKVERWKVSSAISEVKPIRSKIGKKEGLKNTRRYDAYEYVETGDGRVVARRRGILRATKVADNRYNATGTTGTSEFYQIAGGRLEPGMTLRQRNDLAMSLALGYRRGGLNGYNIKLNQLAHINTRGISHYVTLDMTFDVKRLKNKHILALGDYSTTPNVLTPMEALIGYGIGFRLKRFFEFVPNLGVGLSNFLLEEEYSTSMGNDSAVAFKIGLDLNISIAYPVQLFVGADYGTVLGEGENYKIFHDYLKQIDKQRKGLGISAGLRFTF